MDEICRSNIMQRDNKKFAKKLDKNLAKLAKEKNKTVSKYSMKYTVLVVLVICFYTLLVTIKKYVFYFWDKNNYDIIFCSLLLRQELLRSYEEPPGQKRGEKSF